MKRKTRALLNLFQMASNWALIFSVLYLAQYFLIGAFFGEIVSMRDVGVACVFSSAVIMKRFVKVLPRY